MGGPKTLMELMLLPLQPGIKIESRRQAKTLNTRERYKNVYCYISQLNHSATFRGARSCSPNMDTLGLEEDLRLQRTAVRALGMPFKPEPLREEPVLGMFGSHRW